MQKYEVENHEPSYLPDGKKWKLVWNDEFDGDKLDDTKWDFRCSLMGKRNPSWLWRDGIRFENSNIIFMPTEKWGDIRCAQLQTGYNYMDEPPRSDYHIGGDYVWPISKIKEPKFMHRYGYYECRCKLQKKKGWWTAFWLQSPQIGSTLNPAVSGVENDIMESFTPGVLSHHANHYNGYGADHKQVNHGEDRPISLDEYHTFGMMWNKDGYTFYVDGVEDGHSDAPVSHVEQFILLGAEINGYRTQFNTAETRDVLGDEFTVDYVRVFDEIEE